MSSSAYLKYSMDDYVHDCDNLLTNMYVQAQPIFTNLIQKALELVRACPCSDDKGCPNCVQHVACTEYNAVISKSMAVIVLECALEHELKIHGPTTLIPGE